MTDGVPVQRMLRERVAEEVRALMARKMMTGADLAAKIGRSPMYVSRRVRGEVAFDLDDMQRLAEVFDVPVQELMPAPQATKRVGGAQAIAHYLWRPERTSDQPPRPPARPVSPRPVGQLANSGPGRTAYLPRSNRRRRDR